MKDKNPWQIIKDEVYETFPIFTLKKSTRRNPLTGTDIDFVRLDGLDWVNVIAFTESDELIMVRQYRHGAEEYTLEFPGGCVEKDEPPMKSGLRELLEETGYAADTAEFLAAFRPNPAMLSVTNFFYVARNCKLIKEQALDAGEDIQVLVKPYQEVLELLKAGTFNHGMGAAGLALYALKNA